MKFHILTIFPKLIEPYLGESIIGRGVKNGKIQTKVYDLRDFVSHKHNRVDDKAYGGGPGMVISIEPLTAALTKILKGKSKTKTLVVLTAPGGKDFSNKMAGDWIKKYTDLVIVAGRYEGLDSRIKDIVTKGFGIKVQEVSVGPYVLTGGEIPALILTDVTARQIPGVLGKSESLEEARYGIGMPIYTRPETFRFKDRIYRVPRVLLSGNHADIDKWRKEKSRG